MDELSSSFFLPSLETVPAPLPIRKTRSSRRRLFRRLVLMVSDLAVIQIALATASILLLEVRADSLGDVVSDRYLPARWLIVSLSFLVTSAALGLYTATSLNPLERFYRRVHLSLLWPCLALGLAAVRQSIEMDLLAIVTITALLSVPLGLIADAFVRDHRFTRSLWSDDVVLIGCGAAARRVALELLGDSEIGLKPIGIYGDPIAADESAYLPRLGSMADLEDGVVLSDIAIVVASPETRGLNITSLPFARVLVVPEVGYVPGLGLRTISIGAVPAFDFVNPASAPVYDIVKRIMDVAVAIPALLLALPAMLCLAVVIFIVSPGPIFYVQQRVGWHGRSIKILKLRSMYMDAERRLDELLRNDPVAREEWQTYVKLTNDPRILPFIGDLIRRSSIDELPQLWNVIRGDISLIGPRPLPRYHIEMFSQEFQKLRSSVKPGLTGLWQVSLRNSADLRQQEKIDSYYIRNWSLLLDIYILLCTGPAVLSRRGAR
jgi:Undecaprenyl-phosphate galactose phosphotransferase WbaP